MLIPLDRAETIEIAGADALAFAHAQFTSDVENLAVGTWHWSAWLSAQGRVRAMFVLLRIAPDRLLAWLPLGGAAGIRDALSRFVLRAKVRLTVPEGQIFAAVRDEDLAIERADQLVEHRGGFAFAQNGPQRRIGWLGAAPETPCDPHARDEWRLADIGAGLPWIAPALQDEFVPQALGLERLDAIRFDKGCYPGQEIAARLHFRGGNKRHLYRVRLASRIETGSRIGTGEDAGVVLYSAPSADTFEALAVLSDAAVSSLRIEGDFVEIIGRL